MARYPEAHVPTMYFVGVTTQQSSIMKIFPIWARELGLDAASLIGIDLPLNADPSRYREVVSFIKKDNLSLGALVTTHKMKLLRAARNEFDYLDPYASMFEEISVISKRDGQLEGYAKDPISSGLAMERFIPHDYWVNYLGEVLVLGSGGSALAISAYLSEKLRGNNIPERIILTNNRKGGLREAQEIISRIDTPVLFEFELTETRECSDALISRLKPHSLVVNATGMGKDRPGSPITDRALFPESGMAWEINYRGELEFLHQAKQQQKIRSLYVEDGWVYFVHGWAQAIAEVFHVVIDQKTLSRLSAIAKDVSLRR